MRLNVNVNGTTVRVSLHRRNDKLRSAIDAALRLAEYTRETGRWQVRDAEGHRLNEDESPRHLGLVEDDRLFVTLPPGIGA